jgi:hypothetical protein
MESNIDLRDVEMETKVSHFANLREILMGSKRLEDVVFNIQLGENYSCANKLNK